MCTNLAFNDYCPSLTAPNSLNALDSTEPKDLSKIKTKFNNNWFNEDHDVNLLASIQMNYTVQVNSKCCILLNMEFTMIWKQFIMIFLIYR